MAHRFRALILITIVALAGYILATYPINLGLDLQGGTRLVLEAQETPDHPIDEDTMLGILSVIRTRVNGLGVSEPVIQRKSVKQIIVELPGVKDPERAIRLIGETALLEFAAAEWAPPNLLTLPKEKQEIFTGPDADVKLVKQFNSQGELVREVPIILRKKVLTGADLKKVNPGTDEYGQPIVHIEFTSDAAKVFYDLTSTSVGKPIAILLDGTVISAPNVNNPIPGGRAYIEGNFSITEMRDLVIKLKAGSLPVPVAIISNKIVGPTLGSSSIAKSKTAGLIGLSMLCVYMIIFYRLSGLVANIGILVYLTILVAVLKLFHATLTLPGIAGIILTMGMAVDANVIVFERIRDELANGETLKQGIQTGFSKALVAILDANTTTLLAAIVLFWLGTGSIKGFALTLSIGILVSMFSAIFVTKVLLDTLTKLRIVKAPIMFKGKR